MFNQYDKPPPKDSVQRILGLAFAAAAVSTLGAKLVDWAVEEVKKKYGSKPAPPTADSSTNATKP